MELVVVAAVAAVLLVLFTWIGREIGRAKGRRTLGAVLGFLLGPVGWAAVYMLPETADALADRIRFEEQVRLGVRRERTPDR